MNTIPNRRLPLRPPVVHGLSTPAVLAKLCR
jgi:hypothetical protein